MPTSHCCRGYARWAADTAGVEVLALDENGHAAAWIKSYGGLPGGGFVRLEADDRDPTPARDRRGGRRALPE